ncbi:MAG: Hsp20/alpha crystallin family protein, partial [Candidatus Omnitrophica bacterium]|nr:Hsp20/alpha crystallin family protein [Candidatus Omnitrophota bacterium]
MTLIPLRQRESGWWEPFRDLERIQDEMNKLFDFSLAKSSGKNSTFVWNPAVDVYETKDHVIVKADLPGMEKDEIQVSVQGDTLIIKGEKKQEKEHKEEDYVRTERAYGSFYRALALPESVDSDKVKAAYKNGVLELTLPKKEEVKPK